MGRSDGEWLLWASIGEVLIGGSVVVTEGNRESGSGSPTMALYNNSDLTPKTITLTGRQLFSADQSLFLSNPDSSYKTHWVYVEEAKR